MKNADRMIVRPLQNEADYEAALDRVDTLMDANAEDLDDDELNLLDTLIEDYEDRQVEDEEDENTNDYELVSRIPNPNPLSLAKFNLSNGNEVRFLGIPVIGEVLIVEIADAGTEDFLIDPQMSPVEIFYRLAPESSAIPRMLAQIDRARGFEGRELVDTLEQNISVSLEKLGVESATNSTSVMARSMGSCQPGPAGSQFFEDHHCNTLGGPGYGKSESYCFPVGYGWVEKTSSRRRRTTYTRMASCGTGKNRLRHFYKTISGYKTQFDLIVEPQKVVSCWSAKKGIRRYRRVRFEAHESGGWVRGWVKYHSQIAEGWF